jgi:acetyltransferase EpsM
MTARVVLIGAGRFAEETTDVLADAGIEVAAWIEGLDAGRADPGHEPPILWVDELAAFEPDLRAVPAIGSPARRGLVERIAAERGLATAVHPSAVVARTATLDDGVVLFPGTIVAARSRIGSDTIVNRGATVGHHTTIGAHGFLGPGAIVAGGVTIGAGVRIGLGALVRDDLTIGDGATVGMGAVCLHDVPAGATVVGNPARPLERA